MIKFITIFFFILITSIQSDDNCYDYSKVSESPINAIWHGYADTLFVCLNGLNEKPVIFKVNDYSISISFKKFKSYLKKSKKIGRERKNIIDSLIPLALDSVLNFNGKIGKLNAVEFYSPIIVDQLNIGKAIIEKNKQSLKYYYITFFFESINESTNTIYATYFDPNKINIFKHKVGWDHYDTFGYPSGYFTDSLKNE